MKRFFITGTDTDCGKTYVTSQLIKHFPKAIAIKPVGSGCTEVGGKLISSDAQELVKNNGLNVDLINPWRFELPVSPHIAAEKEDKPIHLTDLVEFCKQFEVPEMDTLFIEGAGGLLVPLNNEQTWVDFLKLSKTPVIVVVGMKLGCINHALLTVSVLKAHNLACVGWIANCLDPNMLVLEENIETLSRLIDAPLMARVPYRGAIQLKDKEKIVGYRPPLI